MRKSSAMSVIIILSEWKTARRVYVKTISPQPVRQTDTELSLCSNRSGSCVRQGFVGGIFMASTVANSTEVNSLP